MALQSYWPYLIPPLLGAMIGYVTNYIAIRMLFRPLRPWHLFRLRVPLTPGIIPAKRGELAARMGEMVGDHLFTADDVGHAFAREAIQRELRLTVTDKLSAHLDRQLGPLDTLVPERFRARFRELVGLLQHKTADTLYSYLQTDAFEDRFRTLIDNYSTQLLARDLASFLSPERYRALQLHLESRYCDFFQSPRTAALVGDYVDRKTEQLLTSRKSLRELLPEDLVELIVAQLEKELPALVERFGGLLYDPDFRARMVTRSKSFIDSFLDSLGGLAGLLSGFIDLEKLYARIPDFLDKAGDEVAAWLREEKTQAQLTQLLRERIDALLERSPASFVEKLPYEKISGVRSFARQQALAMLQSRRTVDTALVLTESALDRLKDRSFDKLLRSLLPDNGLEQGRAQLTDYLLTQIRAPRVRVALEGIVVEQTDRWIYQQPLGVLAARLPGDLRQEIEHASCQLIEEMLKKEAPKLVETLNVRRMVEEKVNGLDLLQVEGLLMGVMQEQFKYINLFGALLGFLIGLANLLVLQLM